MIYMVMKDKNHQEVQDLETLNLIFIMHKMSLDTFLKTILLMMIFLKVFLVVNKNKILLQDLEVEVSVLLKMTHFFQVDLVQN